MSTGYIPVKTEEWAKMVEATKVAADLMVENKRLKDDLAKWVNLSVDHEKEVAELQAKVADLAAENERLREAGDLLERALILRTYKEDLHPSIVGWDAAKEGGAK